MINCDNYKNIQMLKNNNIPVIIQIVMTRYNVNELQSIYRYLLELWVERLYIINKERNTKMPRIR
jgi:MoaA/NifB/PqqE/SkfB family radical SAM enzyme